MAAVQRSTPDRFQNPLPQTAPSKAAVRTVLNMAAGAGIKAISLLSGLLAAILILYSGYVLYDSFYTQNKVFASASDLMQFKPAIIEDEAMPLAGGDMLAAINEDYRAWLTLYDTGIDYPVMQGKNDLYYSSHDIYGNSSLTGSIYLASGNSADMTDSYNLIYGHHMDNGALFGGLDNFADRGYFESHREGMLVSSEGTYDLTTFAVMTTDAYDSSIYNAGNRMSEVVSYTASNIGGAGEANTLIYDASVVGNASRIVALSTCAAAETNGRLVVFAVMTPHAAAGQSTDDPSAVPGAEEPAVPGTNNTITDSVSPITAPADPDITVLDSVGNDSSANTAADSENAGPEAVSIDDSGTPLAGLFDKFQPTGGAHGTAAWALVNLICLIITLYMFLPMLHLRAKYGRESMMKKANELDTVYQIKAFVRRFRVGIAAEILAAAAAVVIFILTENMRLPMVLIDKWTPLMIICLAFCWIADVRLIRYREGQKA